MPLSRREINDLADWTHRAHRKPLVIRGARQVGKSTLVRELAERVALNLVEVNFERNPELKDAFTSRDPAQIVQNLQLLANQAVRPGESLLFLDEIQAAPDVLTTLRYFYEEMPALHVIAAGSLLEFTLADARFPMPVGRVDYMHLGPMQFEDFLEAIGETQLASWLRKAPLQKLRDEPLPTAVHDKLVELLRQYWVIGGMPEAIAVFAATRDIREATRVHHSIVATYRDDFGRYSHGSLKERVQLVFDRLPTMVGRKFKYAHVSQEHRSTDLAAALQQLCMARVAHKVLHTSANGVPLGAEADERHFKTLYLDVGLMCTALHLGPLDLRREALTLVNDGALAEQFVGQHLLYSGASYEAPALHYWNREAKSSSAEIDYLIDFGQQIVPVEVKSGRTGTLKSLHYFLKEKQRAFGLRFNGDTPSLLSTSTRLPDQTEIQYELLSLPLYLVGQTRRLLEEYFTLTASRS